MKDVVLLIEDDADMREGMASLLEHRGHRVVTAEHGRAALEALADKGRPCLIILDLMMPVMNGWELRAELMADPDLSEIPVVVLSGVADIEQECETLGAADYLTKPIDFNKLYGLVRAHCHDGCAA